MTASTSGGVRRDQPVMQMAQMDDAHRGRLEDEDRVAGPAAVAHGLADVGGHVSRIDHRHDQIAVRIEIYGKHKPRPAEVLSEYPSHIRIRSYNFV